MSETLVQIGSGGNGGAKRQRRPEWLRIRLRTPASYHEVRKGSSAG